MKAITILFAGAALLATGGTAIAQERGGRDLTRDQAMARADQRFARLDANRDGNLTREEVRQARQMRRGQGAGQAGGANRGAGQDRRFERLDANRDGSLSREEFAARRAMRGNRAQGGARGGAFADGMMSREEFRARALQRFERLDANRDGIVTVAERQQRRQERQQGRN